MISLLKIGSIADHDLLEHFFHSLAGINPIGKLNFRVLRDFANTADAELTFQDFVILFETKIVSGALREEQIKRHLTALSKYSQKNKKLVLLTPDNLGSHYLSEFQNMALSKVITISWSSVIKFFKQYESHNPVLLELINEYIEEIQEQIFEQDICSVIVKISFGDVSGLYPDEYLDEFRNGEWKNWHTPGKKPYYELDGKGKKLILYDNKKKGLVLEVEIEKVSKDPKNRKFPWCNRFAPNTLRIYKKPISLKLIKTVPDKNNKFSNFDKCSTSHWNLTTQQYDWLMKKVNEVSR